jgi:hypothetical protein
VDVRRLIALGASLLAMAASVGPAASEPAVLARLPGVVEWPRVLENSAPVPASAPVNTIELLAVPPPVPAPLGPDLPTLTASAATRDATDLRFLLTGGERWHLMELGVAATWRPLAAKIMAFGHIPYAASDGLGGEASLDQAPGPTWLGLKAGAGGLEAGAEYRSAGKRLDGLVRAPAAFKDREGYEVWAAQRFGVLRLRLSDSVLSDNVDRNPALPRTTRDQSAVSAELSVTAWPVLGLTYATGESSRVRLTPDGHEGTPERRDFDSVTGSAYYYGGPGWDVTISSTLGRSSHIIRPENESVTMYQDLSLTIRLLDSVNAIPSLGVGQEHYALSGVRSDTGTAGLTFWYMPAPRRWWASSFVSVTSARASDASVNASSLSVGGAVTCALGRWLPPRSTLTLEAGYDRYTDGIVPASSSRSVSGFVLLRIAAF